MTKRLIALCALALSAAAPALAQSAPTTTTQARAPAAEAVALVSSADPRASAAGREMLDAGGSATDAALATMIMLTLVEPQSSGIGGGGFFVHHDGATNRLSTIDGRETAPRAARPDRFLGADGRPRGMREVVPGGISVGVPGNIRLMAEAHRRWGRLPWAQLFAPTIRTAEEGFRVNGFLAATLAATTDRWADFPQTRALYYIDGRPAREGETLRNPEFARMLRDIAARGPDAFYTGTTARAIVAATTTGAPRNPGDMTMADLAGYRAREREPVCYAYRVYRVCGMGPPSSGGTTVLSMLGMLEHFDLPRMGRDNPMSWHLIREAMHLAYADRDTYLGDPAFVDVPTAGLLNENYLASRSRLISPFRAAERYAPGTPPGAPARVMAPAGEVPSTSHFVAVDRYGSVVSMTSTVEGHFGSQLVARGMILNNELTDFTHMPVRDGALVANRVQGGARPRSSMSPTIVYDANGRVVLAVGSAGGPRIIMHVLKTLVGVLDWGMSAEEAIALPNLFMAGDGDIVENTEAGRAVAAGLTPFGRPVLTAELGSKLNAADRDANGNWRGAADPRSLGAVAIAGGNITESRGSTAP
jgi:gamma-glutamyltranspeptidase / glutathione hydrolase